MTVHCEGLASVMTLFQDDGFGNLIIVENFVEKYYLFTEQTWRGAGGH